MQEKMNRRLFVKQCGATAVSASLLGMLAQPISAGEQLANGAPHAEKIGWHLGCQAWTFHFSTFYETIEKVQSLGLHYIEAFPGQKLSAEHPNAKTNETLSPKLRKEMLKRLSDAGIKLVNYGVTRLTGKEAHDRKVFDFAKEMGIETIVSEPPLNAFDTLDKLCQEYQINVALHNHPKPSRYWNPDTVLKACEGHSKRIGACADIGHWMRSGLNPLEQLKKLKGRIICFHFKDLNAYGPKAHDVPWGTGKANVRALLEEIYAQKLKAVFSIEYEYHWGKSLPEIAQCVKYFDKVAAEISGQNV